MAGAALIKKKFMELIGEEVEEPEYDEVDYAEEYEDADDTGYEVEEKRGFFGGVRKNSNVVPMTQQIVMKISKPTNFEQANEIVEQLKQKNAVVINLEYVSKDVARRIVDVVCGAVQALDGNMEKVSNSIFVVAPYNYDIVSEIAKEKIENKFAGTWIK